MEPPKCHLLEVTGGLRDVGCPRLPQEKGCPRLPQAAPGCPDHTPGWRYSLSLANLSALDSAGASSLTTKGTINFFCNPFSFTSHTNARLPRLNPSLTLNRSSPSRTLHFLDSLVYTRREASCDLRHHVQASRLNQPRASPRALVLIAMLTN